jgi:cell division septation protein DedD
VKLIKGLGQFLKSKLAGVKKRRSAPQPPMEDRSAAPKNGRLVVAVVVSVLIMIALVAINMRLIRDPSIAIKAFSPIFASKTQPEPKLSAVSGKQVKVGKPDQSGADLTFWSTLKSPDGTGPADAANTNETASETKVGPGELRASAADKKADGRKEGPKTARASRNLATEARPPQPLVPKAESSPKIYTVQVGAFSRPAIAQEWARKWKARGYQVWWKPVARPKTGVIYQLYMGTFTSEKEANNLIKRLKSKEGINAFRLLVRE